MTIFYVLAAFIVVLLAGGYYFARVVLYPKVIPWEKTLEIEIENGKLKPEEFEHWEKEEITIHSPNGYDLFGLYFPMPDAKHTIVISHGITYSLYGSVKYMNIFRKLGWNILIYDLRNHGRSGGTNTTFGQYEKFDLKACVDWVLQREGDEITVGTMGESLGASVSLLHAAIDRRVKFVIADCAYSNLNEMFAFRLKEEYKLPAFPLLPLSNWFCKKIANFDYANCAAINEIRHIDTPMLFIHGSADSYTPPYMSKVMYKAKIAGENQLYLAPGSDHAQSYWDNPQVYTETVHEFLDQILTT